MHAYIQTDTHVNIFTPTHAFQHVYIQINGPFVCVCTIICCHVNNSLGNTINSSNECFILQFGTYNVSGVYAENAFP